MYVVTGGMGAYGRRGMGSTPVNPATINVNSPTFGVIGNPSATPPASANMAAPPSTTADANYLAYLQALGNQAPTACTCVAGACLEDGNSCSSGTYSAPMAPIPGASLIPGISNTTLALGGVGIFALALMMRGGRR